MAFELLSMWIATVVGIVAGLHWLWPSVKP